MTNLDWFLVLQSTELGKKSVGSIAHKNYSLIWFF